MHVCARVENASWLNHDCALVMNQSKHARRQNKRNRQRNAILNQEVELMRRCMAYAFGYVSNDESTAQLQGRGHWSLLHSLYGFVLFANL
jgi:hypothetical protein